MSTTIPQDAVTNPVAVQNDAFRNRVIDSIPMQALTSRSTWEAYVANNNLEGMLVLTQGVFSLEPTDIATIKNKVVSFDKFTPDNDPYGEHDFGSFKYKGGTYFWKIDYYDVGYEYHSPNKENPEVTRRVLTVMHSSEY